MSASPPKADIRQGAGHVRFVPKADIHSTRAGAGRGSNLWPSIVAGGNGGHATIAGKPIKYSRRVSEVIARAAANV
jgi:hypothetical protein